MRATEFPKRCYNIFLPDFEGYARPIRKLFNQLIVLGNYSLVDLQKFLYFSQMYLGRRSIKPEHLSSTDLEARVQDSIHHLPDIILSYQVRLHHQAGTTIEISRALDSRFA